MPRQDSIGIPLLLLPTLLVVLGPSTAAAEISFVKDVQPFLKKHCVECHTQNKAQGGVALDSYNALIRGNDPVVRPRQPERSDLVKVLTASAGRKIMPPRKATTRPTEEEIAMIRAWVMAGAPDDTDTGKDNRKCQPTEDAPANSFIGNLVEDAPANRTRPLCFPSPRG
jgi:mono/diheme cytochrome c family protein